MKRRADFRRPENFWKEKGDMVLAVARYMGLPFCEMNGDMPKGISFCQVRYKEQPQEILDHAKKGGGGGRYSSVNLLNEDTIEFRIFRGTLKYNTLIATLQLVERICSVATVMSDDQLKNMPWTTFAAGCTSPELVQYLKERRLYVNEVTEGEEEV